MAKLQLALDDISLENALSLLQDLQDDIDIVEVGTPFMIQYGMKAVREIRKAFPELYILCDGKIMDAGAYEAEEMLHAGADCITVLAVTDDSTIRACVKTAEKYHADVMTDMLCVQDLASRAKELEQLGVDIIAVHTGVDQQAQGRTPLMDLKELKHAVSSARLAVAGGIKLDTVDAYLSLDPDIIIVGSGILREKDPRRAARDLCQRIHRN